MAGRKDTETKAEELLKPIAEVFNVKIYDVEYVKEGSDMYLRAYIDKEGGVNIQDCENVSRAFSDKLDEADIISDAYILEVSSPGLGRQLKKDRHFENSLGEDVELKLFEALDGQKEYEGTLKAFDKDSITVTINGEDKVFARNTIAVVRLKLDI